MSSVSTQRKTGRVPRQSKGGTNGNGHVTVVETPPLCNGRHASSPARQAKKVIPGRYERPYSCVICLLRLSEEDSDNMDRVLAEHGRVVRIMCSCHTALMNDTEFRLLRRERVVEATDTTN